MTGKGLRKIIQQSLLIFSLPKKKKKLLAYISNNNSTHKKQVIILMIPNEEKGGWHFLAVKKIFILNIMMIFIVWIVFIPLEQKINLNLMKKYVKIKISGEL